MRKELHHLKKTVENKCDEDKVKKIVSEEIKNCNEDMVKKMVKEEVGKIETPITEEGCNEEKVKAIITEEISKIQKPENKRDSDSTNNEVDKAANQYNKEGDYEESKEVRENADKERLNELFKDCKIQLDKENLKRLGKFNKEKLNRPILVKLPSAEPKITLFRNIHYIKTNPKYEKVGVSNDLTQAEREQEKRLWDQARRQTEEEVSGDYHFRNYKTWNKLPDKITKSPSINSFKNRLDKYWSDEEIYYNDYRAEISVSHGQNSNRKTLNYESGEEEP
ncbi:unnamed protein product [Mytilus edulis]|uniref:Uncharacterized protein n=1 Tax=Mytilus edulis TaxID=6550 RepID=A0A8S3SGL9_MYTED|nr:unnamed protein product [Mytilus edulis]